MSLLPNEKEQYSAIIDGILASSNLETISAKQIRKGLQAKLEIDISDKTDAVKALIMERFDKASQAAPPAEAESTIHSIPAPATNGHASPRPAKKVKTEQKIKSEPKVKSEIPTPSPEDDDSDVDTPPKKKRKQATKGSKEMDDAQLAAMLQAQENSRTRATRGGGTQKKKPAQRKKTPKKKSADKIKADEDSEMELDSSGEVKQKEKKGGFHKQYHLSAPLADLVGEPTLSRPQVVKKIWIHIKAHGLQDPSDKRQIECDEKMQLVFKQDKVHMFTMNKILGKHLYPIEEE